MKAAAKMHRHLLRRSRSGSGGQCWLAVQYGRLFWEKLVLQRALDWTYMRAWRGVSSAGEMVGFVCYENLWLMVRSKGFWMHGFQNEKKLKLGLWANSRRLEPNGAPDCGIRLLFL